MPTSNPKNLAGLPHGFQKECRGLWTTFDFVNSLAPQVFSNLAGASTTILESMSLLVWLATMGCDSAQREDEVWARALTEMQRPLGKR